MIRRRAGRPQGRSIDGDDTDGTTIFASADAISGDFTRIIPFRGGNTSNILSDGDGAAFRTVIASADAGSRKTARGSDRAAANFNIAAGAIRSAADAGTTRIACSIDRAATNGDIAAGAIISATDACSTSATYSSDRATADNDIAARFIIMSATDAGIRRTACSIEAACAADSERGGAAASLNARIINASNAVHAFEDDIGIAHAFDSRTFIDGNTFKRHRGAAIDGD